MTRKDALQYIKNTNGGATIAHFCEDWEPVGRMEWGMLTAAGLATTDENGRIKLTDAGVKKLEELS